MIFNSYLFIIVFCPIFFIIYYLLINRCTNICHLYFFIIVASFLFYSKGNPGTLLFLACSISINYMFHELLVWKRSKLLLALAIAINICALCGYKYLGMGASIINLVLGTDIPVLDVEAPLGISFITFQQIAFLVYSYENSEKVLLTKYMVLISFFPHVAQGPILDPKDFLEKNLTDKIKRVSWENIASGVFLFIIGLSKKTLLADTYGTIVDTAYLNLDVLNMGSALFVSLAYSLQIYFDFSGYCDMAMGIGRMMNIELPINFNSPYKSDSIDEFWDRWHITLTRFLTRYLYFPLGGSRKGLPRTIINILVVFLVSGLWHGASITFLIWGAIHGTMMAISRLFKERLTQIPKVISCAFTFLSVNFAWVFFRAGSLTTLKKMTKAFMTKGISFVSEISESFVKVGVFEFTNNNFSFLPWLFLLLGLIIVFGCKNSVELVSECKWRLSSAMIAIVLLFLCIFSFTGVQTYIYLSF